MNNGVMELIGPTRDGEVLFGSGMTDDEALAYAQGEFPYGRFCLVRDWTWTEFEIGPSGTAQMRAIGIYPVMIFANHVVFDSQQRWVEGSFVRTSALVSFRESFIFETRNTTYLLLGMGQMRYVHEENGSKETRTLH